jgi:hypothetical protein
VSAGLRPTWWPRHGFSWKGMFAWKSCVFNQHNNPKRCNRTTIYHRAKGRRLHLLLAPR